jgi:hypothetical protein
MPDLKPSLAGTIFILPFVIRKEDVRFSEILAQENWIGANQLNKQGCKLIVT